LFCHLSHSCFHFVLIRRWQKDSGDDLRHKAAPKPFGDITNSRVNPRTLTLTKNATRNNTNAANSTLNSTSNLLAGAVSSCNSNSNNNNSRASLERPTTLVIQLKNKFGRPNTTNTNATNSNSSTTNSNGPVDVSSCNDNSNCATFLASTNEKEANPFEEDFAIEKRASCEHEKEAASENQSTEDECEKLDAHASRGDSEDATDISTVSPKKGRTAQWPEEDEKVWKARDNINREKATNRSRISRYYKNFVLPELKGEKLSEEQRERERESQERILAARNEIKRMYRSLLNRLREKRKRGVRSAAIVEERVRESRDLYLDTTGGFSTRRDVGRYIRRMYEPKSQQKPVELQFERANEIALPSEDEQAPNSWFNEEQMDECDRNESVSLARSREFEGEISQEEFELESNSDSDNSNGIQNAKEIVELETLSSYVNSSNETRGDVPIEMDESTNQFESEFEVAHNCYAVQNANADAMAVEFETRALEPRESELHESNQFDGAPPMQANANANANTDADQLPQVAPVAAPNPLLVMFMSFMSAVARSTVTSDENVD
jgi:hypothetical protein